MKHTRRFTFTLVHTSTQALEIVDVESPTFDEAFMYVYERYLSKGYLYTSISDTSELGNYKPIA